MPGRSTDLAMRHPEPRHPWHPSPHPRYTTGSSHCPGPRVQAILAANDRNRTLSLSTGRSMATTAPASKPPSIGTAILDQLVGLDARSLSPETAREFLAVDFEPAARARVKALMAKAQEDRLGGDEQDELDEFLHVADLLAILHSKARQALRPSRKRTRCPRIDFRDGRRGSAGGVRSVGPVGWERQAGAVGRLSWMAQPSE